MSKRWGVVAGALLLLCAAPVAAFAVAESMVTLTLGSGTPNGSFAEIASSGAMAGLNVGYRAIRRLEVGATIGYFSYASVRNGQQFSYIEPSTGNLTTITMSEHFSVTELGVYGRLYQFERGRLGAYLQAGAGAYNVRFGQDVSASTGATLVGGNEQQNKFGFSGGMGARFRVSGGTYLGLEAVYHQILGKGRDALGSERNTPVSFTSIGATLGFGPSTK